MVFWVAVSVALKIAIDKAYIAMKDFVLLTDQREIYSKTKMSDY